MKRSVERRRAARRRELEAKRRRKLRDWPEWRRRLWRGLLGDVFFPGASYERLLLERYISRTWGMKMLITQEAIEDTEPLKFVWRSKPKAGSFSNEFSPEYRVQAYSVEEARAQTRAMLFVRDPEG